MYNEQDLESARYAPPGTYRGFITGYETGVSGKGTEFLTLSFKIQEPLSGQDLNGVELNRELRSQRFYLSDAAAPIFIRLARKVAEIPVPTSPALCAEALMGQEVTFEYTSEVNTATGKSYTSVTRFSK